MLKLGLRGFLLLLVSAVWADVDDTSADTCSLPLLELPYGTWRASHYNEEADVYTFRNIRYAAPPLGELRWAKPAPPNFLPEVQDGSYGHNCIPSSVSGNFSGPSWDNITKDAAEDCLFLDVYVPGKVLRQKESVAVVIWIHGGGYVTGSKDQAIELGIYDGTSLIQRADDNLIVVCINYRLGAFGFLTGEPLRMHGTFNAGLHDQRAALEWVQSYISLLGGDPNKVSAWGQSAGGGSIMYHLVAEGGKLDPLFNRAMVQSPGFGTNANIETQYQRFDRFLEAAGCSGKTEPLKCLRSANTSVLRSANEIVFSGDASPVPDGRYIRNAALVEYASGNTWKHLDSLIITHVVDEGSVYIPNPIPSDFIQSFIATQFPANSTKQVQRIVNLYETRYANSTRKEMASAVFRDLMFTCKLRVIAETYPNPTWAFRYSIANATHGNDMVAQWYNPELQNYKFDLFADFQRYITNHVRTGNPNDPCDQQYDLKNWPMLTKLDQENPGNVLDLSNVGYQIIDDSQMQQSVCNTWIEALVDAVRSQHPH